ncbi:hypothetical protein BpsM61_00019 [Bacillus phage vB_BpsM-61]|nr:hypothetical protein BpsM61_00019 [Bacillus phage vB_BpsM-61]
MIGEFRPQPKPQHKRRTKKRGQRGLFTEKIKEEIFERDQHRCIKCGSYYVDKVPHHVIYKSQGGEGIKRNGVCVCRLCHDWAHLKRKGPNGEPSKEGRKWFERWVEENLDDEGNLL